MTRFSHTVTGILRSLFHADLWGFGVVAWQHGLYASSRDFLLGWGLKSGSVRHTVLSQKSNPKVFVDTSFLLFCLIWPLDFLCTPYLQCSMEVGKFTLWALVPQKESILMVSEWLELSIVNFWERTFFSVTAWLDLPATKTPNTSPWATKEGLYKKPFKVLECPQSPDLHQTNYGGSRKSVLPSVSHNYGRSAQTTSPELPYTV